MPLVSYSARVMRSPIRIRFVSALAAVSVSCAGPMARGPVVTPDGVRFTLEHAAARSVSVAGDFNDWSPSAHPLTRRGSRWSAVVVLPAGEHKFMFVVDGAQWIVPPLAEDYMDDGFGSRNGVVIVR
jgi:1,4-alpha-glucan branching enzyme